MITGQMESILIVSFDDTIFTVADSPPHGRIMLWVPFITTCWEACSVPGAIKEMIAANSVGSI